MNKFIKIVILALNSLFNVNAQQEYSNELTAFVSPIERKPKWVLGTNEQLIKEITLKIDYPNEQCIEGLTVMQFTVDTLGHVNNPIIRRSISNKIDEQLLRLICNYEFEPGTLANRKVKYILKLPIKIKLE